MIAIVDGAKFAIAVIEHCLVELYRNVTRARQAVKAAPAISAQINGRGDG